jgi:hypothetical protein
VQTPSEVRRTHIAIDRFTGGVLPAARYTMETPESASFTEDLHDGITGIGGGGTRGYGSISVDFGEAEAAGLPDAAEARRVLTQMLEEQ